VSAVSKVSARSPKQVAAARANLVKARLKLRGRARSAKQTAASRRNLAKGRAAQAARRGGKSAVTSAAKKKPTAPLPGAGLLHAMPACGPAAAAEHLAAHTGIIVPDESVLVLHELVRPATIGGLLEYLAAEGFPGTSVKLAHFERCDPDAGAPGLVYGLQLGRGYHAVVGYPGGAMASWGMLLRRAGTPEEAWWLEWEDE
jgi:hypothetical protein